MMRSSSRVIAAAVGVLVLLCLPVSAHAQSARASTTSLADPLSGSIAGVVHDDRGKPLPGVVVSALGAKTSVVVTDRQGRFEFRTLSPGSYLVRAHMSGFLASRGQVVDVRASGRSASSLSLRRAVVAPRVVATTPPVLTAGLGGGLDTNPPDTPIASTPATDTAESTPTDEDHGEVAWRLRHVPRGVLKDLVLPADLLADNEKFPQAAPRFGSLLGDTSSSGFATNLFAGMPLTGQFNLLTASSFDSPQQLFGGDSFSRGIAYVSLAAPMGDGGDWSVRGALTQGDISSWFVAGTFAGRAPGRHRYDAGLSYSTQRYEGGNALPFRELTDNSRSVGAVYAFDTLTLTPAAAITYGARFSRYDYLAGANGSLLSPRLELVISPAEQFRVKAVVSSRALAPGAEEFLPPIDIGLWLPPQRTFSPLVGSRELQPERTDHLSVEAERDLGVATVSVRVLHQHVSDQLVTLFGVDMPGEPTAKLGHYLVDNNGDVDATGWSAAIRTTLASRIHGSMEYSWTDARWTRSPSDATYMLFVAPSIVRPAVDRIQGLSTSFEANVPETATRVLLFCRLTSARAYDNPNRSTYTSRFDVQVHQSLPFMDFSTARWEMLFAVRNTFREATADSSVYDELLVAHPPKRVVGGLTLRF